MKKILLLSLLVVFVFASTSVYAAEKYALGMGNVALRIDYLNFSDDAFEDIELENALYVGLEGYYAVAPNLYLGLEAGWAGSSNDGDIDVGDFGEVNIDVEVTFIPIELNLKYVVELDPSWSLGFGAGISYSYFEIEANDIDETADAWVFGGQLFTNLNYKINKDWFIGINAKYQLTEDLEFDNVDTSTSASNFRVGAQVGLMF